MKKFARVISIALISIIGVMLSFGALGFRVNLTDSIPVGVYRLINAEKLKDHYVIFCPDDKKIFRDALNRGYINHGLCSGGYGYLMKKVVAVSGDIISVTPEGVFVNGILVPFSKPKLKDGKNEPLTKWRVVNYKLSENEILTMTSQSEWSFDSRYYGVIRASQIKGVIAPVFVKYNGGRA